MQYDSEHNPVLGIDLGTTNSVIAHWKEGRGPVPYEVDNGEKTLPSVVYYNSDNSANQKFSVGKSGLKRGKLYPTCMDREFKRRMNNASHNIILGGKIFSPIELSAEVLKKIYSDVAGKCPEGTFQSRGTVVTVPYDFEEIARENTKQAAKMANINFKELLEEPIAASLSYALEKVERSLQNIEEEKILVFDLGGGTFDLTLFHLQQNPDKLIFEVLATGGDSTLGGIDFDQCLTELLLERSDISLANIREVTQQRRSQGKLKDAVIQTKHDLSDEDYSNCIIPDLLPGSHLDLMIKRQDFELSIELYINKIKYILSQFWKQAEIHPNQVDRIILVGGSSRIPCIRQLLIENIGSDKIYEHPRPDLCVAEGAAIYAAYLEGLSVFGNREVEIVTDGFNANISSLNEKIEDLHQQVSELELQLADKKNEIQTLENRLNDIQTSKILNDSRGISNIDPWGILEEKYLNKEMIDVQVTGINHGGVIVEVFSLKGFIPRSHLVQPHDKSIIGQSLKVLFLEFKPEEERLVFSERKAAFSMLRVGQLVEGEVVGIKYFGIFVEFNGLRGLLHISEVSAEYVLSLNQLFDVSQKIKAVILNLNDAQGRLKIDLSTKVLEKHPGEMLNNMETVMSEAELRLPKESNEL